MTPWTVACQVPQSMGFSRQGYWRGLPFPSLGDLPDPVMESGTPALQADSLLFEPPGKPWKTSTPVLFRSLKVQSRVQTVSFSRIKNIGEAKLLAEQNPFSSIHISWLGSSFPTLTNLPLIGAAVLTDLINSLLDICGKCCQETFSSSIFFFFNPGMRKNHSLRPFIHFPSVSS